jgi:hypothetical protein
MTNYIDNQLQSRKEYGCIVCEGSVETVLSGGNDGLLLQPFTNLKLRFSEVVNMTAGVRYLHYTYNGTSSLEPRASLHIKPANAAEFSMSYGLISQLQLPQVYAATGNSGLELTKSHHFDLGYAMTLAEGFSLKAGTFYQSLFDVPIGGGPDFTYSTLNLLESEPPSYLFNDGTGENYGVDATLEKSFYNLNYFLIGGSYYESKYKGADGVLRNTRFNGNYTINAVYGKEWTKPSRNRTIGLNTRLLYLGGLRQSKVNEIASSVSPETVYDAANPFSEKLNDYFRIDLRLSFRKNKPGYTRTFAIDIQNLTSQQNEAFQYYDNTQQKVVTKLQLGIIPVLVYRIDF